MKNSIYLCLATLFSLSVLTTSCTKENIDTSITTKGTFEPSTNIVDITNGFYFTLSKVYPNNLDVKGGSSELGTNISKEVVGNQLKWTLYSSFWDGITVENSVVFFTNNTDAGTYPVSEYKLAYGSGLIEWLAPEMNGTITVSDLSTVGDIANGTVFIEKIDADTTYTFNASFDEVIILE